ncbi:hypothetical protein [Dokdonella ginsengisoli]|uniref:DUF1795 domain-containing protein n=1 Tax=Dokdonella ginsengisoli TaxID=363846 RepID=A0ABV9QW60_9GAMM
MQVGGIYHHDAFYAAPDTGESLGKYLIVLAVPAGDDVVFRLLTSRYAELRPPECHHGAPYPGYGLGVPGGELQRLTWVDLRSQEDYDIDVFRGRMRKGHIRHVLTLNASTTRSVLLCVAGAQDTTRQQARHVRDSMAVLNG